MLIRWANLIQPATLQHLLDHVVELARHKHLTRGRDLRLDSTVVATNIHYPVDSTLLADGVRVLTCTIARAKPILQKTVERARTLFRNRTRSVRRVTKLLIDADRRRAAWPAHTQHRRAATARRRHQCRPGGATQGAIELGRRVACGDQAQRRQIKSPADIADLLLLEMSHLDQEQLRTVLLDTKNRIQATSTVYIGSLNTSMVRVGEVFKEAVRRNSAALIVVHNHPSGDANPSPEDVLVTREIVQAGKLLDVDVLDHMIIGHGV
jgi:hypothetical protein